VGLERGSLSLVGTIEELLLRNSSGSYFRYDVSSQMELVGCQRLQRTAMPVRHTSTSIRLDRHSAIYQPISTLP
jgi:hypothetical protein